MRIISKFRDYYDHSGFYSSEERLWVRESKEVLPDSLSLSNRNLVTDMHDAMPNIRINGHYRSRTDTKDRLVIVGYCGKIYVGIRHYRTPSEGFIDELYNTYHDYGAYIDAMSEYHKQDMSNKLMSGNLFYSPSNYKFSETGIKTIESDFNKRNLSDLFIELNAPLFMIENIRKVIIVTNPIMLDNKFMLMFKDKNVNQDIDMYLGNDLVKCTLDDFVMSDELKRDSKGMNEYSFKQRGPKKRKSRK